MRRALLALAACGGAPHPAAAPLALTHGVPIAAHPQVLIEQGDALYMLASHQLTIVRNGIVTTRIDTPHDWIGGTTIAAPDGDGRWIIAIDDQQVPWRITLSGEREPVAERLGLGTACVQAIGGSGTTFAADLGDAIAYTTDGVHLTRVPVDPGYLFAVARGTLARAPRSMPSVPPRLERWDLVHGTRVTYPLTAQAVAFLDAETDHPRLVAVTNDRLYVEQDGQLVPYPLRPTTAAIAARGDRLWLDSGGELFLFDHGKLAPARLDDHDSSLLAVSATGDAWLNTMHGLVRYSLGADAADAAWQAQVAPVFQRVCAHCHLPGGEAGIDLSTAAAWQSERAEIAHRVLETRTMPPAGTDLGDADRAALEHWLGRTR